tara:strand:- start:403 stop:537 length:135 start_codon:yes stop_codon:yes gene_type:complete
MMIGKRNIDLRKVLIHKPSESPLLTASQSPLGNYALALKQSRLA